MSHCGGSAASPNLRLRLAQQTNSRKPVFKNVNRHIESKPTFKTLHTKNNQHLITKLSHYIVYYYPTNR